MASQQSTVDFLVDQFAAAGTVSARKMFGEYAIYCDGKMFALVCDDQLFVKPIAASRDFMGTPQEAPPYPQAKPWYVVPGELWDDREWLCELARRTAAALPLPPPKVKKEKKAATAKKEVKVKVTVKASPAAKTKAAPAAKTPAAPAKRAATKK